MASEPLPKNERRQILKVLFISLLLDLISFTFILPLFPSLLSFYRTTETSETSLLPHIFSTLNAYKQSFSRPINDRYDVTLLGGALGSLFSLLQAFASPIIGTLSDKHGRRTALLWSMAGNIASVALWVAASDFKTFLASRIVGGLSEGNVQLATSIAADISDEKQRGATMALVGACFSIAFTFGPALGAYLSTIPTIKANPFATAAGFSLLLIVTETVYLYFCLPETRPTSSDPSSSTVKKPSKPTKQTNSHFLLNTIHLLFIFFFSGMEFSLPFLTYDLFSFSAPENGRLLGYMGLISSLLQGGLVRRMQPLRAIQVGVLSCAISFFMLGSLQSQKMLYVAATLLSIVTATVVTGLRSLSSFEAGEGERGEKLGAHRSWGQVGRALGPLAFCTLYWWAGREMSYNVGAVGVLIVCGLVFGGLKMPATPFDTEKKGQ
ncbi:MAG: hypothetical protein M1834_001715 [Cirrosporium novae-zelandiae]|nr:MAG: hypothetical protein M1834_001715 [Cirrosporium novae-zelandiae]